MQQTNGSKDFWKILLMTHLTKILKNVAYPEEGGNVQRKEKARKTEQSISKFN